MGILRDISFSIRLLRRTPGYTYVAVITLALAIAANGVVFSLINAAILKPLPYRNPERLGVVSWYNSKGLLSRDISAAAFLLLREHAHSFESMAAIHDVDAGVNLSIAGTVHYAQMLQVSSDFFQTLGASPLMGRSFSAAEDKPGGPLAALLSYSAWTRDLANVPSPLGQEIHINGESYTVIGVMPPEFHSFPDADLWIPLQLHPATTDPANDYRIIARFKDGVTIEQAQHELDSFEYAVAYQLRDQVNNPRLVISRLQPFMVTGIRQGLNLLFGAVLFALLVTCTNLIVLMTVRISTRSHEAAVRLALGAGRWHLTRIFLVESLIVSIMGGILGLILAKEMIPIVARFFTADVSLPLDPGVDLRVVFFTLFLSLLTAVLFGLVPALRISRRQLIELLRLSSSTATHALHPRAGRLLVVAQSALTLILLAGAGLFIRSFLTLKTVPPGFEPEGIWAAQLSLASHRYHTTASTATLFQRLCDHVEHIPEVKVCATSIGLPFETGLNLVIHPTEMPEENVYVEFRAVSPEYFQALRIRRIEGRWFSSSDKAGSTPVAVVNASLAARLWPKGPAIGHFTSIANIPGGAFYDHPRQIVGVAADIHETDLAQVPSPTIFVPLEQLPDRTTEFVNRSLLTSILLRTSDPSSVLERLRNYVVAADPDLSVASFRALSQIATQSLSRRRFYTTMMTALGMFALLLSAIGLYGLLSYQLILRVREIGIRMAVGAKRSEVIGLVVEEGILMVGLGIILGFIAVPFERHLLATMLYNSDDKFTFVVPVLAAIILETVGALTSLVSAVRATSIEPMVALRTE